MGKKINNKLKKDDKNRKNKQAGTRKTNKNIKINQEGNKNRKKGNGKGKSVSKPKQRAKNPNKGKGDKGKGDKVEGDTASAKRICKKTPKKCKKKGGVCINYKDDCPELIDADLCKGASCRCCKATDPEPIKCKKVEPNDKCKKKNGKCKDKC